VNPSPSFTRSCSIWCKTDRRASPWSCSNHWSRAAVAGSATPPDPEVGPPTMLEQFPLQLVLFASLHPAVAQMIGLYWADKHVALNQSFDYLIVADHTGP
jgi:hypothetical protein